MAPVVVADSQGVLALAAEASRLAAVHALAAAAPFRAALELAVAAQVCKPALGSSRVPRAFKLVLVRSSVVASVEQTLVAVAAGESPSVDRMLMLAPASVAAQPSVALAPELTSTCAAAVALVASISVRVLTPAHAVI